MSGLTINDPVKFKDIVMSGRVIPGDVLYLRGGTYTGDWSIGIGGTPETPVIIKPYNNENVVIDGTIVCNSGSLHIYDIEITDSRTDRFTSTPGVNISQPDMWLIGCQIHDMHNSGVDWMSSGVGRVSECVIYNNGDRFPDRSGHGHGIYTHNNLGGAREISRNVFFDQIGEYCFQLYSGGANWIQDYTIQDNIICGDPVHIGGGLGLRNWTFTNNVQYQDYFQFGYYSDHNYSGEITNNLWIEAATYNDLTNPFDTLTESGNVCYGGSHPDRAGYTAQTVPATWTRVIPFSLSSRWLASVAIFNRDSAATVDVDFAGVLTPGNYKLRNAQNPAETWSFTYSGAAVSVPTNWTAAQRIGDSVPGTTWARFGGLVVEAT